MKKAFYMMAAAAIALSSCSSEETTDVAKSASITFRTSVGLNSRGAELTTDNLKEMWVSAFYNKQGTTEYSKAYFENAYFKRGSEGVNGFIDPTSTLTWQKDRSYKFIAISPAVADWKAESNSIAMDEVTFTKVTPASTIKDQKDLIIGTATGTESDANNVASVNLNLSHVLSQIKIAVKNQNSSLEYTIRGFRIAYVAGSGNYSLTNGWSEPGEKVSYEVKFTDAITIEADGTVVDLTNKLAVAPAKDCGAMLIPQSFTPWGGTKETSGANFDQGAYISLLLNVKNKVTGKYMYPAGAGAASECGWAAVAFPVDTKGASQATWVKGNKYIYTLDLSKGCGKVDPEKPEENENKPLVKPGVDGNPDKGENIFGELIAFKVTVDDWNTNKHQFTIDGTTGKVTTSAKKK